MGAARSLFLALALLAPVGVGAQEVDGPRVEIQGAESGTVSVQTTQARVSREVLVVWRGGGSSQVLVDLDATPATPEDGLEAMPVQLSVPGEPSEGPSGTGGIRLDLSQDRARTVRFEASLPREGRYTSRVLVSVNGAEPQVYTLALERSPVQDQVEMEVVQPPVLELSLLRGPHQARIHLQVLEKAGVATRVLPPTVVGLSRAATSGTTDGPAYDSASLCEAAEGTEIPAFATTDLALCVNGVREPGTYTGQVRLTTERGQEVIRPLTFHARDSWLLCAIAIALGALVSWGVHRWTTTGRELALLEARIRRSISGIERRLPDGADPMRKALVQSLEDLYQQQRLGEKEDVTAELERAERRLRVWLEVRDLLDLRPRLPDLILDPADRDAVLGGLDDLRRESARRGLEQLDPVGSDKPQVTQECERIRKRLVEASLTSIRAAVGDLNQDLGAPVDGLPDGSAPVRVRVDRLLEDLNRRTGEGKADISDLRELMQRYLAVRDEVEEVQRGRLTAAITVRGAPPPGMGPEAWQELKRSTLEALNRKDPRAPRAYADALFQALSQAPRSTAEARARVATALAADDPWEAIRELESASQETARAESPKAIRGPAVLAPMGAELPPPPSSAPRRRPKRLGPVALPPDRPPLHVRALPSITRRLRRNDLLVGIVTLAISALAGMELLWLHRPDWGGLSDFIYAFLWGFGLDLVGKGAFERLRSVLPQDTLGSGHQGQVL